MAPKRPVASPKRRKGRERKVIVTVRLHAEERDRIGVAAYRAGKTISAWIRERAVEALSRKRS